MLTAELIQQHRKPVLFLWLADCSDSMRGERIDQLNRAIKFAVPRLRDLVQGTPLHPLRMGAIKFQTTASWHKQPVDAADFDWDDLTADGFTDMGGAVRLALGAIGVDQLGEIAVPPILVLLSDGDPWNNEGPVGALKEFEQAVQALNEAPWGRMAVRRAVAIGTDVQDSVLNQFTGGVRGGVRHVDGAASELVARLRELSATLLLEVLANVGEA
jgi:uncharacterized protein YegL